MSPTFKSFASCASLIESKVLFVVIPASAGLKSSTGKYTASAFVATGACGSLASYV